MNDFDNVRNNFIDVVNTMSVEELAILADCLGLGSTEEEINEEYPEVYNKVKGLLPTKVDDIYEMWGLVYETCCMRQEQ